MNKKLTKSASNRILLYILTMCLFVGCIVISYGFKTSVNQYYQVSINLYKDSIWDLFYAEYNAADKLGSFGILNSSNKIQNEIKQELDMDRLKDSLSNNKYYYDFDMLLRRTLQNNVYTAHNMMDENRNSIFVMSNGKTISNYSHQLRGVPFIDGAYMKDNDMEEYIKSDFYNVELSLNALEMIENQSDGIIVWQKEAPKNPNSKKYSYFDINTMKEIFETEGIDGFDSYTFLIPEYITDYGNIFGEYDTSQDAGKNNKIIVVQKMNLRDYIYAYGCPQSLSKINLNNLNEQYNQAKIVMSIFEIILYISILAYLIFVIFSINNILENCCCTATKDEEDDTTISVSKGRNDETEEENKQNDV